MFVRRPECHSPIPTPDIRMFEVGIFDGTWPFHFYPLEFVSGSCFCKQTPFKIDDDDFPSGNNLLKNHFCQAFIVDVKLLVMYAVLFNIK